MSNEEILREIIDRLPETDEVEARLAEGWRPVAIEWRRPRTGESRHRGTEPPFGLALEPEDATLEPNPVEEKALRMMLRLVIDDQNSLNDVAEALNREGLTTRAGRPWKQTDVFHLLPRMIEVAPGIYRSSDWAD